MVAASHSFTEAKMKLLHSIAFLLALHLQLQTAQGQRPPTPTWPDKFHIQFDVQVKEYGPDWKAMGKVNYNYPEETIRADFIDWCLPLFDEGVPQYNNYTCSFLAIKKNMYFVNHTSKIWSENECCLFGAGLGVVPPDWMKIGDYNGTLPNETKTVDIWWFPGTHDPSNNPCYGYWSVRDEIHTPFRFFGLSSLDDTFLQYRQFVPGTNEEGIDISMPNAGCTKECEPPAMKWRKRTVAKERTSNDWPPGYWPYCGP